MTVYLTEQDLLNIKLTVLTLERQEIARNIDPRRFFGHLRAKYILDERDCDEIRAVTSRIGSAEAFVDILKRKGAAGYDEFCSALMKDQTQLFLLQRMTQTLEQLRAKVLEKKQENAGRRSPQAIGMIAPQHGMSGYPLMAPPPQRHPIPPTHFPPRKPFHVISHEAPPTMQMYQGGGGTLPLSAVPQFIQTSRHQTMPSSYGGNIHKPLRKINSRQPEPDFQNPQTPSPIEFPSSVPLLDVPSSYPSYERHHSVPNDYPHNMSGYPSPTYHSYPGQQLLPNMAADSPVYMDSMAPQGQRLVCRGLDESQVDHTT